MSTNKKNITTNNNQAALRLPLFFRLSINEQILLVKRLALLLKAGVPLLQSLEMMQQQTSDRAAKTVVDDLVTGARQGRFLHSSLEKYRQPLGDFVINIIRVGEVSGTLEDNLAYLAEELKNKRELRRKLLSAMIYPAIIALATLGISVLLVAYVFPKILPVLETFKGQLPLTTRVLIFLSHLLDSWGWLLALGLAALFAIGVFLFKRLPGLRLWLDGAIFKLPVLGRLFQSYYVANFCRTLGILLQGELRIIEATEVAAKTAGNRAYAQSLLKLGGELSRGQGLAKFLAADPGLYPAMVSQLLAVGESTGKLPETLTYLAEIYAQEVDELAKNLSAAIEPILMVFMGLMVGFIAMSIITPIYSLTQSLSK